MPRPALCLSIVAAVHLAFVAAVNAQQVESPGAAESHLKQMEAAYAQLQSYSDNSTVLYRNPDGTERSTVNFKIWFSRPTSFRIDAHSTSTTGGPPRREVMWTDGDKARAWSLGKAVVNLDKIQIAGSRMFGTYAYHVPTLLDASYGGQKRIHQLSAPKMAGEETIDGIDCVRISGQFHGDPYELWIGRSDHLVRKVVASYRGNLMEETHREIAINPALTPEVFKFAPENEPIPPPAKATPTPVKKDPTPAAKKTAR
jgi:outer membrane lipoprotein-sorting protein